ncbi:uncharacterized protein I206_102900 [Kwoniella pini CBS 10737]|uniref:Uncharacterized protein n=1 Tax=Kwoniella pini CBS 10737 TaxID=1296096 RepID=A0A1B9I6M7_9TREE|nr:uncharacterized protein I206_03250 [Kwoniella pini CBS 10737]OCF51184.1 hypothetical protein I206_03250 [Kwoniella pini CBS 10737]
MTTTTPSRYPSSLSQGPPRPEPSNSASGPSRPTRGYPAPSSDSTIGSPPSSSSSVPIHEYSSLADLLQQAGYKDIRVFTPEAEKLKIQSRRNGKGIKKTFDQVEEEEVDSLYDTYGFIRSPPQSNSQMGNIGLNMERSFSEEKEQIIKHQHITEFEPALPMKSSSSILRSLNIQQQQQQQQQSEILKEESNNNSWWNGWSGIVNTRPKLINSDSSNSTTTANSSYEASTEIGLGLAKNGEGVRKVKSNFEIRKRRAGTDSPPQEERPPLPTQRIISNPNPLPNALGYTSVGDIDVFNSPPPPVNIDEDEYGYSPLPEDYEEQCTEDEAFYSMGMNDQNSLYSLGSSITSVSNPNSNPPSIANSLRDNYSIFSRSFEEGDETISTIVQNQDREGSEDRAVREINEFQQYQYQYQCQDGLDMEMFDQINEAGRRILKSTINVDTMDFDAESPESQNSDLPEIESEHAVPNIPLPTIPQTVAEQGKKTLKYGDRATKLRIAHSTPALRQAASASASTSSNQPLPEGWLNSIKSALIGKSPEPRMNQIQNVISQPKGPIKISTAKPALPITITNTPVICDSISNNAGDLPPIPKNRVIHQSKSIGLLRYKPSLAKLRDVVLGTLNTPEIVNPSANATTAEVEEEREEGLILSPRLNWDEQGKHAGWSPNKSNSNNNQNETEIINGLFGPQDFTHEIDYSKSFFYKPFTPPSKKINCSNSNSNLNEISNFTSPPSSSNIGNINNGGGGNLNKKRSIKSLKKALLLPVLPNIQPPQPPVPPIPNLPEYLNTTPKKLNSNSNLKTPILAIQSPGSFVPRELILEGEEWDAREGIINDWGRGRNKKINQKGKGNGPIRKRKSKKIIKD